MVTVPDPQGFPLNLVYGQQSVEAQPAPTIMPLNYGLNKSRIREFQRFQSGPAAVHKVSVSELYGLAWNTI